LLDPGTEHERLELLQSSNCLPLTFQQGRQATFIRAVVGRDFGHHEAFALSSSKSSITVSGPGEGRDTDGWNPVGKFKAVQCKVDVDTRREETMWPRTMEPKRGLFPTLLEVLFIGTSYWYIQFSLVFESKKSNDCALTITRFGRNKLFTREASVLPGLNHQDNIDCSAQGLPLPIGGVTFKAPSLLLSP
jgi:hypothetical protein